MPADIHRTPRLRAAKLTPQLLPDLAARLTLPAQLVHQVQLLLRPRGRLV